MFISKFYFNQKLSQCVWFQKFKQESIQHTAKKKHERKNQNNNKQEREKRIKTTTNKKGIAKSVTQGFPHEKAEELKKMVAENLQSGQASETKGEGECTESKCFGGWQRQLQLVAEDALVVKFRLVVGGGSRAIGREELVSGQLTIFSSRGQHSCGDGWSALQLAVEGCGWWRMVVTQAFPHRKGSGGVVQERVQLVRVNQIKLKLLSMTTNQASFNSSVCQSCTCLNSLAQPILRHLGYYVLNWNYLNHETPLRYLPAKGHPSCNLIQVSKDL